MASKKVSTKKATKKPAKKSAKKTTSKPRKLTVRRVDDLTSEPKMEMETSGVQGVTTIDGMVIVDPNREQS